MFDSPRFSWLRDTRWWLCFAPIVTLLALNRNLYNLVVSDTWYDLVGGRAIAAHGIPHRNSWTLIGAGHHWIDQQWLAQWLFYRVEQVVGIVGLAEIVALSSVSVLVILLLSLYRRGLGALPCQIIGLVVIPELAFFSVARAQAFSLFFFAILIVILATLAEHPRRWPWLAPLIIFWANTHGAVVVGLLLIGAWSVAQIGSAALIDWQAGQRSWHVLSRHLPWKWLGLIPLSLACALITPYGLDMVSYYREFANNSAFSQIIFEWQPPSLASVTNWPFFAMVVPSLALVGANWRRLSVWQGLSYLLLLLLGLHAVRADIFFTLQAAYLLGELWREHQPKHRLAPIWLVPLLAATFGLAVAAGTLTLLMPSRTFESTTACAPIAAIAPVRQLLARDPQAHIFIDDSGADYILWEVPGAIGHIAYDTRSEILTEQQFRQVTLFVDTGLFRSEFTKGYQMMVILPKYHPELAEEMQHWSGWQTLRQANDAVVVERKSL